MMLDVLCGAPRPVDVISGPPKSPHPSIGAYPPTPHPQPPTPFESTRSYTSNMSFCKFPLLAAELAAAGVSSFRFDHGCAVFSKSERRGPFLMGNHADEVQDMADAVAFMRSQGRRVVCLLGHRCGFWRRRARWMAVRNCYCPQW